MAKALDPKTPIMAEFSKALYELRELADASVLLGLDGLSERLILLYYTFLKVKDTLND